MSVSVVLQDIFWVKMERDLVSPFKPNLYKHYVDDIFSKLKKKQQPDNLFIRLRNYHPNSKFSIGIKPKKFLDTKISKVNGTIQFGCVERGKNTKSLVVSNTWEL